MTGQVGHMCVYWSGSGGQHPMIRCVTIKAVGGSDQINDIINPIKYHQQYEQINPPLPSFGWIEEHLRRVFFLFLNVTLFLYFFYFFSSFGWWMMQITVFVPDATDEGSPERKSLVAFPSRWVSIFVRQVQKKEGKIRVCVCVCI